jgi:hypothetical protein
MFTFSQVNFHNPVLSSFATYDWVSNESISTGSTIGKRKNTIGLV